MAVDKNSWRGTLMAVFQPAEETGEGARAMIDDGLFKRFPKPDVILGQHVMVGPSGTVAGRAGADHIGGGQLADTSVWARRARINAAGQH
jgi:hippurate hydrolase